MILKGNILDFFKSVKNIFQSENSDDKIAKTLEKINSIAKNLDEEENSEIIGLITEYSTKILQTNDPVRANELRKELFIELIKRGITPPEEEEVSDDSDNSTTSSGDD